MGFGRGAGGGRPYSSGRAGLAFELAEVAAFALLFTVAARAQATRVRARIVEPVDATNGVVLRGNTPPLARAENDRGAAPDDLPLERMLLVLKRSPEQEASLD